MGTGAAVTDIQLIARRDIYRGMNGMHLRLVVEYLESGSHLSCHKEERRPEVLDIKLLKQAKQERKEILGYHERGPLPKVA